MLTMNSILSFSKLLVKHKQCLKQQKTYTCRLFSGTPTRLLSQNRVALDRSRPTNRFIRGKKPATGTRVKLNEQSNNGDSTGTNDIIHWQQDKAAMKEKLQGARWEPKRRKLSPDTMDGIRALHQQYPDQATTSVLAKHFGVSPEVIRRILKSSWKPSIEEDEQRRNRWEKRGLQVWQRLAAEGYKPPLKWRAMGVARVKPEKLTDHSASPNAVQTNDQDGQISAQAEDQAMDAEKQNRLEWWQSNVVPILQIKSDSATSPEISERSS